MLRSRAMRAAMPAVATPSASGRPFEAFAAAERQPVGEIPGLRRRAGEQQVAEPGKAHQRLGLRAEGLADAPQLHEAARHHRGLRAGAEPRAGDSACGDGEDVLQRAADLDPHQIAGRIAAEAFGREGLRERCRQRLVLRGDHHGGRQALGEVGREARTGECGNRIARQEFSGDFRQKQAGFVLDAFGAEHQRHALRNLAAHGVKHVAQCLRRRDGEHAGRRPRAPRRCRSSPRCRRRWSHPGR